MLNAAPLRLAQGHVRDALLSLKLVFLFHSFLKSTTALGASLSFDNLNSTYVVGLRRDLFSFISHRTSLQAHFEEVLELAICTCVLFHPLTGAYSRPTFKKC